MIQSLPDFDVAKLESRATGFAVSQSEVPPMCFSEPLNNSQSKSGPILSRGVSWIKDRIPFVFGNTWSIIFDVGCILVCLADPDGYIVTAVVYGITKQATQVGETSSVTIISELQV